MMFMNKLLILFMLFTKSFCEEDLPRDLSNKTISKSSIFKCKCKKNEVLKDDKCIISSNPVRVWDVDNHVDAVVDISLFYDASVRPVNCTEGFTKLNLDGTQFLIYTNGLLDNLDFFDEPPTDNYCIDHVESDAGISLFAEVCQANPVISTCCPHGYITDKEGTCVKKGDYLFAPNIYGNFKWNTFNLTQNIIKCKGNEVLKKEPVTFPNEYGASIVGYPLGTMLQWISIFNNQPQFISHSEYCISAKEYKQGLFYLAEFCILDPKIEHTESCKNTTCLRKCCPHGFIYDTMYLSCVQNTNHVLQYKFIDVNGEEQSEPEQITLKFGAPFCEEFHQLSHKDDGEHILKFYADGSLVTSPTSSISHSSVSYCVDGFSFNSTHPNSTITNSAIVCFKETKNMCQWRWIIGSIVLGVSCVFYVMTLIVYIGIEELRNKMVGKCLISQVSALLIAYLTLIFLQNSDNSSELTCNFPGTVEHIAILASFFWLNVMCYDMWTKIKTMRFSATKTRSTSRKFLAYCIYAWGLPLIIGALRVIIDQVPGNYPWLVKSNLGKSHCFFSGNHSLAKWIYLYGPILLLLLINLGFFVHVATVIIKTKEEAARLMASPNSGKTGKNMEAKKERALLYLKLFLVMGISWLLEIIMWVAVPESDCYFWGLDMVNMFQGVFIFAIFVCKKSTLQKVKERFSFSVDISIQRDEYCLAHPSKIEREVRNEVALPSESI